MIDILVEHWRKKIKIVDSKGLFKVICLIGMIFAIGLTAVCEIVFLHSNDYLLFFIINLFLIIYNKPTILSNVQRPRNAVFFVNKNVLKRYLLLEILKENAIIIVAVAAGIITLGYSVFAGKLAAAAALLLIPVNYYLLEVYQNYQKIFLISFILCLAGTLINNKINLLFIIIGVNVIYVSVTFYKQLLRSVYADRYKGIFTGNHKMNTYKADVLYFLRMPLDKVLELLYEILLFGIAAYYLDIAMVCYLVVVLFMVEIEIIQEEKMKEFEIFYNKRNFLELSTLNKKKKYFLSLEFNHMLRYIFMLFWLLIIQNTIHGYRTQMIAMLVDFVFLLLAISYKYYCATNLALKNRVNVKQTWFRLIMLYSVLFNLAPFIFEGTLSRLEGYKAIYGYLFAVAVTAVLFVSKIEKIAGVSGNEYTQEDNK